MSARHKQFGQSNLGGWEVGDLKRKGAEAVETEGPSIDELLQSDHAEVAEAAERPAEIVTAVRMSVLGVEARFCL